MITMFHLISRMWKEAMSLRGLHCVFWALGGLAAAHALRRRHRHVQRCGTHFKAKVRFRLVKTQFPGECNT